MPYVPPASSGPPSGAAGGDLAGTYPAPTIKASVSLTTPALGVASATSLTASGAVTVGSVTLLTATNALTNGAAAALGTLTNAPTVGNPTKWIPIVDNGTTRFIPAW